MTVKVVKVYLALSLVLWAVWGHFKGGSLCLTSSVCWSRQCLISVLTQGGRCWTLFFFSSSLFSRTVGREGYCRQILLACVCSVSSTLGLRLLAVHTTQTLRSSAGEPSEAGPRLHAPPECEPLRLGAQEALRGRFGWACVLCPSQARAAQEFGERGRCDCGLSLPLSFLGVPLAFLLRRMMTVQSPQKA